jgi:hypothetical protein
MNEYTVTWKISLEADTPELAARLALDIMRDPDSIATQFTVTPVVGEDIEVDLFDLTHE